MVEHEEEKKNAFKCFADHGSQVLSLTSSPLSARARWEAKERRCPDRKCCRSAGDPVGHRRENVVNPTRNHCL
jgi:hypothetical protein